MTAVKQLNVGYKIGLYIRASTEEQSSKKNPEGTIKNQELRLKSSIEAKNQANFFGEVADLFVDEGISAKNTKRPELQRMLKAIENKEIDMVMVTEYSRLSRNMRDFAQMWELFKDFGCGLISLREQFDTSSAAGEMMLYNMANLAQFERRLTSERVTAGRRDRSARGLFNGGVIPLGYQKIPNKSGYLEINEDEAETIKAAFSSFLREGSLSLAAKWLNSNNYRPSRMIYGGGNKARVGHFIVGNLRCILTNKFYTGVLEYKDGDEVVEAKAVWPAIIDKRTFNKAQKLLKQNHRRKKPSTKSRYPYTLTGITFCAKCGEIMCGKSAHGRNGKVGYYEHSWSMRKNATVTKKVFECGMHKRVPAKKLEPLIDEVILKLLSNESFVKEVLSESQKIHKENYSVSSLVKELRKEISSYNAQSDSLAERIALLPPDVPADALYKLLKDLGTRKDETEKKLRELKSKQGLGIDMPVDLKTYKKFSEKLLELWKSGDLNTDVKSRIIKLLISKIEVDSDEVIIHLHVGKNKIKRESIKDSLFSTYPLEISEKLKKTSQNIGSRTCNNGAAGGT